MTHFQILDPHKVIEFIIINEPFLKKLVKEETRESKRGRKRIAERKMGNISNNNHCKNRRDSLEEVRGKVVSMRFFDRRGVDEEYSF
ncbi:MAG: hypothetical protein K9W46_01580 [Candidatus Heimdallarchaeum endolithica]|uniref:Uncharacterized protein n=1 Tax=Candidatus Heimdallarchaeum endolithica TaxID=2876572 RepID=A0A9Y1BRD1_9ARCH|nr:MAG: hypothetical protein K9W46_00395 [Candidatus Heimdallarchaeum endolithica]UJG43889.1 MAG: hypothetical protein K9W46_01580 [Candidatus Heimdallarchaeum endolithica]